MSVDPDEDACLSERRQSLAISYVTPFGENLCKRGAAWQATATRAQGRVDAVPLLTPGIRNDARFLGRPDARLLMYRIGPFHNPRFRQARQLVNVASTQFSSKELRQRAASRQSAGAFPQSPVHSVPRFPDRSRNHARATGGPLPGLFAMR